MIELLSHTPTLIETAVLYASSKQACPRRGLFAVLQPHPVVPTLQLATNDDEQPRPGLPRVTGYLDTVTHCTHILHYSSSNTPGVWQVWTLGHAQTTTDVALTLRLLLSAPRVTRLPI